MASTHYRRRASLYGATIALIVLAVGWIVAAPQRKPVHEQMMLDDQPVTVDYAPSATEKDLLLPFYPGATVVSGFTYRVSAKDGKRITYYASAALTSADPAERVSQHYSDKMPGKPRPELVEDEAGSSAGRVAAKRYLLAVASQEEVRQVTITPQAGGCRIQLVRAFGVTHPQRPLRPRTREQRVT